MLDIGKNLAYPVDHPVLGTAACPVLDTGFRRYDELAPQGIVFRPGPSFRRTPESSRALFSPV
jgi:hypothetical protein